MNGKRYNNEPKLNIKKVIGVLVGIAVVIMFIITITKLLQDSKNVPSIAQKNSYFSVYTNNKWGVIDQNGNIVIEPTYDEMVLVPNEQTPVFICTYEVNYNEGTYKTKVLNEKNEEILKGYTTVEAISNQLKNGKTWYEKNVYKVNKNGKFGLIGEKGKELLACNYDSISSLEGVKNCFIISKDNKVGLCNNYGNVILNVEFKSIKALGEENNKEFIVENEENKFGVISADKSTVLEPIYEEINQIQDKKLYVVKENGVWSIINKDKSINITNGFDTVEAINNDNAIVIKKDGQYGVINSEGEKIIDAEYDNLKYTFGENYIAKKGNKYGIINTNNDVQVDFIYTNILYENEADIFVADKEDMESDFLNNNFEVKLTGILSDINIENGYIRIRESGEYKYYNFKFDEKKNTEVLTKNTLFLAKKDGKYGYINNRGEVVVNYQYDDATEQNKYGFVSVNKEGKWGSLNKEGNVVAETVNDLKNNELVNFIGKWHLGVDASANYYTDI